MCQELFKKTEQLQPLVLFLPEGNLVYCVFRRGNNEVKICLTENEKHFHSNVTDGGAAGSGGAVVTLREANVVRDGHRNVKRGQQDKPVPASFEGTVMQEDEAGFLD